MVTVCLRGLGGPAREPLVCAAGQPQARPAPVSQVVPSGFNLRASLTPEPQVHVSTGSPREPLKCGKDTAVPHAPISCSANRCGGGTGELPENDSFTP